MLGMPTRKEKKNQFGIVKKNVTCNACLPNSQGRIEIGVVKGGLPNRRRKSPYRANQPV